MSVFNVCNWWSAQCPDLEDNYDVSSLLCARFGLDHMEKDYVVVGTHSGYLNIYYPIYEVDGNGNAFNYRVTDLLYEQQGGFPILGVYAGRFSSECASLVILGEHNFFCVNDTGQVDFILRLDYAPKCFHSFVVGYYWEPTARLITVIISDKGKLFIYEHANIIWGAHINYEAPVAIQRSNINGLPGCIVTLGPTGQLRLGYLGSDPYLFQIPFLKANELNLLETVQELQQLDQEIKEIYDKQDTKATNNQTHEMVQLNFFINQEVKMEGDSILIEDMAANVAVKELPLCTGYCTWYSHLDLNEIQIMFNMPDGIRCSRDTFTYILVRAGSKEIIHFEFYITDLLHFPTAKVEVLASFITSKGIPRVIQKYAYLPLSMFFKVIQPQKSAQITLHFTVNPSLGGTLTLNHVFHEFFSTADGNTQSIGLRVLTSCDDSKQETITILLGKNADRIRIQTDNVEALPLVVERLLIKNTSSIDFWNCSSYSAQYG